MRNQFKVQTAASHPLEALGRGLSGTGCWIRERQSTISEFKAEQRRTVNYQKTNKKGGYIRKQRLVGSNVSLSVRSKLPPRPTETSGTQQLPFDYIYTHTHTHLFIVFLFVFLEKVASRSGLRRSLSPLLVSDPGLYKVLRQDETRSCNSPTSFVYLYLKTV